METCCDKMKIWKSKKTTSCVPGKSIFNKNEDNKPVTEQFQQHQQQQHSHNPQQQQQNIALSTFSVSGGERAMSPAQSEDSGLAPDRGATYASISLPRENAQAMGIIFADRPDISYPPVIASINVIGPAADFLTVGDRIHQVDGISTIGLTNQHIMNMIYHGDGPAVIEIEYSLPEYISQNSLCVTSKLAQITVEREHGCLGLTLRGGGDFPLIVTHVRPHGPVFKTGRIKPGDRLLRVDNISLISKTLSEAQQILKCGHVSGYTNLTIEYDVSVMKSIEFAMGPLLIEIERPFGEKLGLVLSNYSPIMHNDPNDIDEVSSASIYITSILPASIADRCGALSVGDQILSVDDTLIENTAFSPDEVMDLLDANTGRGYTQIQIMPISALARRGLPMGSPRYGGFNTLESRKSRHRKLVRKSSLPLETTSSSGGGSVHSNLGVCRSERVQVVLDCSHGSGIILGSQSASGGGITIAQIISDSVADRSGCIQPGDRIVAVNKMRNLDINTVRQLLGDLGPTIQQPPTYQNGNWTELEVEFDMADTVIPSSGVFNVKLAKTGKSGLGITVNGSSHGVFIVSEVKPGSPAHRTGSLRAGDILLAVDGHPLQNFNVDTLLMNNKNELTTLTIKRDCLPDFLFDAQHRSGNHVYSNCSSNNEQDIYVYSTQKYGNGNGNPLGGRSTSASGGGAGGPGSAQDTSSFKSSTPQPEYFRYDDEILQQAGSVSDIGLPPCPNGMVQMRRTNVVAKVTEGTGIQLDNRRGFDVDGNTHSLTTEIAEDTYDDLSPYELDYPPRLESPILPPPPPMDNKFYGSHQIVVTVRLEPNGGPLGITLAGSEDMKKPIIVSGLAEGGIAEKSGQIKVGDCLLAINEESIQGMPLSHATKLLTNLHNVVELKILRNTGKLSYSQKSLKSLKNSGETGGVCGLEQIDLEDINKTMNSDFERSIAQQMLLNQHPTMMMSNSNTGVMSTSIGNTLPQPQSASTTTTMSAAVSGVGRSQEPGAQASAIYAKVQRRQRSPSFSDGASITTATTTTSNRDARQKGFKVTLFKDKVYDDYGFSVSDGLYEKGVYVNRIRSGGPADLSGMLRPFDRIMQVNDTKTQDFDCCLTVPLIAAAEDKLELTILRTLPE